MMRKVFVLLIVSLLVLSFVFAAPPEDIVKVTATVDPVNDAYFSTDGSSEVVDDVVGFDDPLTENSSIDDFYVVSETNVPAGITLKIYGTALTNDADLASGKETPHKIGIKVSEDGTDNSCSFETAATSNDVFTSGVQTGSCLTLENVKSDSVGTPKAIGLKIELSDAGKEGLDIVWAGGYSANLTLVIDSNS